MVEPLNPPASGAESALMMRAWERPAAGRPGHRLGLSVISAAAQLLDPVDGGQHESRAETARQPSERPRSKARMELWQALTDRLDFASPELGMRLLHRPETGVDLRQFRVLFGFRKGPVERRPVDLALQVGGITPLGVSLWPSLAFRLSNVEN